MSEAKQMIFLVAVTLLPIIPSYLLFRALPCRAIVEGPLAGFKTSLGGAFAGYFVVFILLLLKLDVWKAESHPAVEWDVVGALTKADGTPVDSLRSGDLSVTRAPMITIKPNGAFELRFKRSFGGRRNDSNAFPRLHITLKDYFSHTLHLQPPDWDELDVEGKRKLENERFIDLKEITLKPVPKKQSEKKVLSEGNQSKKNI